MNLYAWTQGTHTIYTASETPSAHDTIYNASGQAITSVGDYDQMLITAYNSANNSITVYIEIM